MEKKRRRESKEEIQVYRVSSKATKLFLKVIKATSINVCMYACVYLCMYGYIYMCTDVCMYVHVYMRACIFLG